MNIRKNIDYSEMYEALDYLMAKELPQMELYCEIGKAVCQRTEKGAAVMASEYLNKCYPDVKGFSPRSLRRMRDFYRTYEDYPNLLSLALQIGWIQNVVIMEAELPIELREWYMKAALQFGWPKAELIANIYEKAHEILILNVNGTEVGNKNINLEISRCERNVNLHKQHKQHGTVRFIGHNLLYIFIKKFLIHPQGVPGRVYIRLQPPQPHCQILIILSG